ncbi:hypothetical protein ACF0H5_022155 [Mactra antiquata]
MYAIALLIGFLGFCSGQDFLTQKILKIWTNMDTNYADGQLTHSEVVQYFHDGGYYSADGTIQFLNFDYIWGLNYSDPLAVTDYIFKTWDSTAPSGTLSDPDFMVLANEIDTNESTSQGYISYSTEFVPYFRGLYSNSPGFGRRL